MNLSNKELLKELDKRIKDGTIKVNFESKVLSDSSTDSNSSLFDNQTLTKLLLFGSIAFAMWYSSRLQSRVATTTVDTSIQIEDGEEKS